ncbi:MAG: GYF domain-containing protein [Kiritimatiellia bacterium]
MNLKATWYTKTADGTANGPLSEEELHQMATNGEVAGDTLVSKDRKNWLPAIQATEVGLDCLVLSAEGGLNVLGPFAHENLLSPGRIENIPQKGILFLRASSVESLPAISGETGTSLVARLTQAESAVRQSERRLLQAEAETKAKDLEMESERAALRSEIAALKAAILKKDAVLESAKKQAEADKAASAEMSALEARIVDLERLSNNGKRQLLQLESDKKELSIRNSDLQAKTEQLTADWTAARNEVSEARKALEGIRAEAEGARKALEQSKQECEALKAALAEARAAAEAAMGDLEKSRAESKRAKAAFRKLSGDLKAVLQMGEGLLSDKPEVVEPEVVYSPNGANGEGSELVGKSTKDGADRQTGWRAGKDDTRTSRMAALESQLQKELSMAAQMKAGATPKGGHSSRQGAGRGGFVHLFQS